MFNQQRELGNAKLNIEPQKLLETFLPSHPRETTTSYATCVRRYLDWREKKEIPPYPHFRPTILFYLSEESSGFSTARMCIAAMEEIRKALRPVWEGADDFSEYEKKPGWISIHPEIQELLEVLKSRDADRRANAPVEGSPKESRTRSRASKQPASSPTADSEGHSESDSDSPPSKKRRTAKSSSNGDVATEAARGTRTPGRSAKAREQSVVEGKGKERAKGRAGR